MDWSGKDCRSWKVPVPDTSDNEDPLGPFDAFRARRAEEQAANEPFPAQYPAQEYTAQGYTAHEYTAEAYAAEPYVTGQYAQPVPEALVASGGNRGRLRSVAVLAGAAVLVAGVVGGVYAATRSSGSPAAASGPAVSASPSAGASKGAKSGKAAKAVTARLTVTSVSGDSFTATAADGQTVSVQIAATTKFGTAARPFTRSQLVTGAVVYARLRHEADGSVVATVIASSTATPASASASPNAGA